MRADFAAHGWSLHTDLGGRLAFVDALALFDCIAADPSSYTASHSLHMMMPADLTGIITAVTHGGDHLVGDLAKQPRDNTQDKRVTRADTSSMFSSYFNGT